MSNLSSHTQIILIYSYCTHTVYAVNPVSKPISHSMFNVHITTSQLASETSTTMTFLRRPNWPRDTFGNGVSDCWIRQSRCLRMAGTLNGAWIPRICPAAISVAYAAANTPQSIAFVCGVLGKIIILSNHWFTTDVSNFSCMGRWHSTGGDFCITGKTWTYNVINRLQTSDQTAESL